MQSSTPSIKRESLSPKTLELAMHPQETNWNESHVHKQRRYFNKANQIFIYLFIFLLILQMAILMTFCMHPIGKVAYSINVIFGP